MSLAPTHVVAQTTHRAPVGADLCRPLAFLFMPFAQQLPQYSKSHDNSRSSWVCPGATVTPDCALKFEFLLPGSPLYVGRFEFVIPTRVRTQAGLHCCHPDRSAARRFLASGTHWRDRGNPDPHSTCMQLFADRPLDFTVLIPIRVRTQAASHCCHPDRRTAQFAVRSGGIVVTPFRNRDPNVATPPVLLNTNHS